MSHTTFDREKKWKNCRIPVLPAVISAVNFVVFCSTREVSVQRHNCEHHSIEEQRRVQLQYSHQTRKKTRKIWVPEWIRELKKEKRHSVSALVSQLCTFRTQEALECTTRASATAPSKFAPARTPARNCISESALLKGTGSSQRGVTSSRYVDCPDERSS